jgi:hypothetical protein
MIINKIKDFLSFGYLIMLYVLLYLIERWERLIKRFKR